MNVSRRMSKDNPFYDEYKADLRKLEELDSNVNVAPDVEEITGMVRGLAGFDDLLISMEE